MSPPTYLFIYSQIIKLTLVLARVQFPGNWSLDVYVQVPFSEWTRKQVHKPRVGDEEGVGMDPVSICTVVCGVGKKTCSAER